MNLGTYISFVGGIVSFSLALVVFLRDRRSLAHRSFALGMFILAVEAVLTGLSSRADSAVETIDWQRWRLLATALLPGVWLTFSLTYGRGNYKAFLEKYRWILIAAFTIPVALWIFGGDHFFGNLPKLGVYPQGLFPLAQYGYVFYLCFLIGAVLILMNLERTLRASIGHMRWQVKFMVLGIGAIFAVRIYTSSHALLFRYVDMTLQVVNAGTLIVGDLLVARSLLRSRLLNVSLYPSHSFVYHSITVLIVGIYFIVVSLLANVTTYLNGGQSLPVKVFFVFIAFLGLSIFLLSDRLRRRMKRFVSHHLKRPQYDYRKEWAAFTQCTSSVTETLGLCSAVAKMVSKTLDILSVTIWLMDEKEESLTIGGSTIFTDSRGEDTRPGEKGAGELAEALRGHLTAGHVSSLRESWTVEVKSNFPEYFGDREVCHCIPLIAGERVLGVMTLTDRVENEPFTVEDFDLVKTVADQTAGSLLNLRLSERLRHVRELEAYQTVSAFMMHDLKNLASRLSLTMQNLPVHGEKPEFRKDALNIIEQSVSRINNMCSRLSLLSQKLELQRMEVDLNELVTTTLSSLNGYLKASLLQDLQPVPKLIGDPEQIQKVLNNLVLNAREAVGDGGEIQVATCRRDNSILLSVRDNGCGMSREFMAQSLFRPFKTTKKQGMGIGLYHCKMIVEAHGGKIEVESEVGQGTTFRVFLPLKKE